MVLDVFLLLVVSFEQDVQRALVNVLAQDDLELPHGHIRISVQLYEVGVNPLPDLELGLKHQLGDVVSCLQLPVLLEVRHSARLVSLKELVHGGTNEVQTFLPLLLGSADHAVLDDASEAVHALVDEIVADLFIRR